MVLESAEPLREANKNTNITRSSQLQSQHPREHLLRLLPGISSARTHLFCILLVSSISNAVTGLPPGTQQTIQHREHARKMPVSFHKTLAQSKIMLEVWGPLPPGCAMHTTTEDEFGNPDFYIGGTEEPTKVRKSTSTHRLHETY